MPRAARAARCLLAISWAPFILAFCPELRVVASGSLMVSSVNTGATGVAAAAALPPVRTLPPAPAAAFERLVLVLPQSGLGALESACFGRFDPTEADGAGEPFVAAPPFRFFEAARTRVATSSCGTTVELPSSKATLVPEGTTAKTLPPYQPPSNMTSTASPFENSGTAVLRRAMLKKMSGQHNRRALYLTIFLMIQNRCDMLG